MPKKTAIAASSEGFAYAHDDLKTTAEAILRYAKKKGASACEVEVSEGFGLSVSVRAAALEAIEHNRDKGIGITVYVGQKKAHASSSDFSRKAQEDAVDAALNIARFTEADAASGLPDQNTLAKGAHQELHLLHPWDISPDEARDLALACEAAGFAHSKHISNSDGAAFSSQQSQFVLANSAGFLGGYAASRHSLSAAFIAGKGKKMQRDDWYSMARNPARLLSPEAIGKTAAARAIARLTAKKIKTCEVPVLFEAPVAASLIGHFVAAASGGNLYRNTSFLKDAQGRRIFAKNIHIHETPFLEEGLASCPFDNEGVEVSARDVVSAGVLNGYFLSTYSARKLGMTSTGNAGGPHNLIVKPGRHHFLGLIKKMGRGLIVTELLGQGVNYVNGDYSRGAAGFWVENGEIAHAVEEVTIAGNLLEMFQNIVAVGKDVHISSAKQTGSILIEKMKVAGK